MNNARRNSGFSLIELVIVVVIIAIIGAIAIPRMSRGAAGAADSALTGNLAVLRNALDLYATEHGGTYPSGTAAHIANQLTQFTDSAGTPNVTKTSSFIYGPYLRKIPTLPVGGTGQKGSSLIALIGPPGTNPGGWLYTPTTGEIVANTAAGVADAAGVDYNTY